MEYDKITKEQAVSIINNTELEVRDEDGYIPHVTLDGMFVIGEDNLTLKMDIDDLEFFVNDDEIIVVDNLGMKITLTVRAYVHDLMNYC